MDPSIKRFTETTGQRIERIATERGLPTGKELAALFGVSYETLRKWKSGESAPNRRRAEKVATVLSVPVETFMHGVEPGSGRLTDQEERMVNAMRRVLPTDRERFVSMVEHRAREIETIAIELGTPFGTNVTSRFKS